MTDPETPRGPKQVIVMRADLHMRKGKIAAQAAHACQKGILMKFRNGLKPQDLTPCETEYFLGIFRKVTLQVGSEAELMAIHDAAMAAGLEVHLVTDSGLTEFHGVSTKTCLAIGPCYDHQVDPITGGLKLY
jgi:PTH2 family peptidyl-tRNA hydrolase